MGSAGSSQEARASDPVVVPPCKRGKGEGEHAELKSSEMATAGLPLHDNSDKRNKCDVKEREEQPPDIRVKASKVTIKNQHKKVGRCANTREQDRILFKSAKEQHKPKEAPSNADKEGIKLETSNKGRDAHDYKRDRANKKDSKGTSSCESATPVPEKRLSDRSRDKANESKERQHLRGSFENDNDPDRQRATEKSRMDHSKVSGSHAQKNNNNTTRHRHSGKNNKLEDVKKNSGSVDDNTSNERPVARRGRQQSDEKGVRFRRSRSQHDVGRGDQNSNDDGKEHQNTSRQRSKSTPQHSSPPVGSRRQRSQRKRIPAEYHTHQRPRQTSALSNYRQEFLKEVGQMSVHCDVPREIGLSTTG